MEKVNPHKIYGKSLDPFDVRLEDHGERGRTLHAMRAFKAGEEEITLIEITRMNTL